MLIFSCTEKYAMKLFIFLGMVSLLSFPLHAAEYNIPIKSMEEFSGLSREDILKKRQIAVKNSIFGNRMDYMPNPSVYQIEDDLPWISAHEITCYGHGTKGPSRESMGILNPAVLYYPLMAAYNFSQSTGCSDVDYLNPYKITFNKALNQISVHINYTSFYKKNKTHFRIHLSDTNARDLGYNYVYAPKVKNIRFAEMQNISNTITPTRGFYHRGGSCGIEGGCNNYSPRQYELEFYLTDTPAEIDMNLWKNYPSDLSQKEDIQYRLFFD